jgi:hypothetical protein
MWSFIVPYPEVEMCAGSEKEDNWYWPHAAPQDREAPIQEWIP